MSGGGTNDPPSPAGLPTGGEFLLSLVQNPQHFRAPQSQPPQLQSQLQNLTLDPAVAALGPTLPLPTPSNGGRDLAPPWPHTLSPPLQPNPYPHNYFNFSPPGNNFHVNHNFPGKLPSFDEFRRFGFDLRGRVAPPHALAHHSKQHYDHQQHDYHNIRFASSTPSEIHSISMLPNGGDSKLDSLKLGSLEERETGSVSRNFMDNRIENSGQFASQRSGSGSNVNVNLYSHGLRRENFDPWEQDRKVIGKGRQGSGGNQRGTPPQGFGGKLIEGDRDFGRRRWVFECNGDGERSTHKELNQMNVGRRNGEVNLRKFPCDDGREQSEQSSRVRGLIGQLERPGPPAGSNLLSVSPSDAEDSMLELARESGEDDTLGAGDFDEYVEKLADSLLHEDELDGKNVKKQHRRDKDFRSDTRGQHLLSQRMRNIKRFMECRSDIHRWNASFLEIYESLIPPEQEKAKQKQLLALLDKLVSKEWPEAQLYLYGSCANSFGVCKSDIDVCLAIPDTEIDKSEVLLKLAEILESDNLQNVQALTRARVPIVKLMDPATGISCDICINNVLAVVNTKLLRDYAEVDSRLRQLAFIVKYWAKSRGVNETYHGTLSSYAYVLMCIHFLQQRRPAILPCLQEMEKTYSVTVDDIECSYFDQVEKLQGFGLRNGESIAQLVWAFFHYWAYRHDYANSVISVRTGNLLSKQSKDWTRRIGNDRHLICIEDPFDTSHDLGRVVDKFSIKVLREELERAAEIMQCDPNPCVALFEPYVRPSNP